MLLFAPGPIRLGGMAEASLRDVVRGRGEVIGRYTLTPVDRNEYMDRMGGVRRVLGRRYGPLPGTWASFVVPSDRDEFDLVVGLERAYGEALVRATEALSDSPGQPVLRTRVNPWAIRPDRPVVSEYMVRSLGMGFLARAGV